MTFGTRRLVAVADQPTGSQRRARPVGGTRPCVHSECYRRTTTRTTKSLDTGRSISVLRRALDGVDDEYIDGAALRVELQSELFLQRRID